jgi:LacI family transcriptional regulator
VPEDVAIIGSGNLHYNSSLRVALSSVDQRSRQLGERAAKLMLKLIEAKTPVQPKSIILDPEIVPRVSTQRSRPIRKKT